MEKVNLGAVIPAYPMPVSLVGAHVNGKPNFLAVAWFSMVGFRPPRIAISLGQGHYTNPGIKEHQAFSLCLPSEKMVEITDYCGIVSGKKTDKDKAAGPLPAGHRLLGSRGAGGKGLECGETVQDQKKN